MQNLLRGSTSLASSIPISKLPMPSAFKLRTRPFSPFAADSAFGYDFAFARRPSISCRFDHSFRRTLSPLLLKTRDPCPALLFTGSGGRGLTASQALRGREKRASTDDVEKDGESTEESGGDEEDVVLNARPQRQRGGISASAEMANVDLLMIPGVGPRNLRKLVDKGFRGVSQLKQLYRDKFYGESSQKMVKFLQSSIGIIHKNHAESITSFIKESVNEEVQQEVSDSDTRKKKRLTFCVEGNISVGKTTFLQRIANETLELRDLVEVVPEPISKWQDIGPDHFNILDAFYAEPKRYAYTFQNYVFVTRFMQERDSAGGIKPLRLMERSVFSDRMVSSAYHIVYSPSNYV